MNNVPEMYNVEEVQSEKELSGVDVTAWVRYRRSLFCRSNATPHTHGAHQNHTKILGKNEYLFGNRK